MMYSSSSLEPGFGTGISLPSTFSMKDDPPLMDDGMQSSHPDLDDRPYSDFDFQRPPPYDGRYNNIILSSEHGTLGPPKAPEGSFQSSSLFFVLLTLERVIQFKKKVEQIRKLLTSL